MKYENRVVCFLDILGFKEHIKATLVQEEDDEERIDSLVEALDLMKYLVDKVDHGVESSHRVTQFSDSIVISFDVREPGQRLFTFCSLLWVFINLTRRGVLIRGGISEGKIVHTDKVLFGPAMNEAYRLESEVAIYPRVIVAESVLMGLTQVDADCYERKGEIDGVLECIAEDPIDGLHYVDYIAKAQSELDDPDLDYPIYLSGLKRLVETGLLNELECVRKKYKWLNEKLQSHLNELEQTFKQRRSEFAPELVSAYDKLFGFDG